MEPRVGEALCRLFPPDENIDIRAIAQKAKHSCREKLKDGHNDSGPYHSGTRYPADGQRLGSMPGGRWSSVGLLSKDFGYKGVAQWGLDIMPG